MGIEENIEQQPEHTETRTRKPQKNNPIQEIRIDKVVINIGVGEATMVGLPAAIGNAVYNAIGVRIRELPISSEKVLKALKEKQQRTMVDLGRPIGKK